MKRYFLVLCLAAIPQFATAEWNWKDAGGKPHTQAEFDRILEDNAKWVASKGHEGKRGVLCHADLHGAPLSNRVLSGLDLSWTNLDGAQLDGATLTSPSDDLLTDLTQASLKGANLKGAKLIGAYLGGNDQWSHGANLLGANLEQADLTGADLTNTDLDGADLIQANLTNADLTQAKLSGVALNGATLHSVKMVGASLTDAILGGKSLIHSGADFGGADLQDADLTGADLSRADLTDTHLVGTQLEGAEMKGTWYQPTDGAVPELIGIAQHLANLRFHDNPHPIVNLRNNLYAAGYDQSGREVNRAYQRHDESWENWLLFDWTCAWGADPIRPLVIGLCLGLLCTLIYWITVHFGGKGAGLYHISGGSPLDGEAAKATAVKIAPRRQRAGMSPDADLQRSALTPLHAALLFSLMSSFTIGVEGFNGREWIRMIMPREFDLRGRGWIRTLSGMQALAGAGLIALSLLSYFGHPFE